MSDVNAAAPAAGEGNLSARDAAARMSAPVEKPKEQATAEAPAAAAAAPVENSPEVADTGAEETQPPGEAPEQPDAASPPIEPPRAWTAAEKEAFNTLPRAAQESISERERARDAEINRRLSEIAERTKASEAERAAALQAKQQYEAALPNLLTQIQQQLQGEFQDITSWQDVEKMQQTDPLRFQRWQVRTQQAEQLAREVQTNQTRQQAEQKTRFENYVADEAKKFLDLAPEFADPKTASVKQKEVQTLFADVGVTPAELKEMWNGQPLSIHDHRVQVIVAKAARWDAAEKARKAAKPVTGAPVQKPGTASNRGEVQAEQVRTLRERLNRTGSVKDAVAILNARRG